MADDDNHWKACACGDRLESAVHTFAWKIDREATKTETGLKHEECSVCGRKRSENTVIDKLSFDGTTTPGGDGGSSSGSGSGNTGSGSAGNGGNGNAGNGSSSGNGGSGGNSGSSGSGNSRGGSSDTGSAASVGSSTAQAGSVGAVQTGDTAPVAGWLFLLFLSASAVWGAVVGRKRR